MAKVFIIQPSINLCEIDESQLAAYQSAGWVEASPEEYALWQATDPYNGTQGAPLAPPLRTFPVTEGGE